MSLKKIWLWEIYFFILLLFIFNKAYRIFSPDSSIHFYFSVLNAFHPLLIFIYLLSLIQIFLNIFHCIPVFCYIHKIKIGGPRFWQTLFILRIIFDVVGHSYQIKYLTSLYYFSPKVFAFVFLQSISIYIPSYIACYRYAFKQEKYFQ